MSTNFLPPPRGTEEELQRIAAAVSKGLAASSPQMLLALEMMRAGYQLAKAEQPGTRAGQAPDSSISFFDISMNQR